MKAIFNRFYLSLFIFIIILDQATKYWALHYLGNKEYAIAPFMSCMLVFNRGFSWGIANSSDQIIFSSITILIIATYSILLYFIYRGIFVQNQYLGLVFILAGGFSNIIDRFMRSAVIDFICLSWQQFMWPAIFNIADVCIVVGAVMMVYELIWSKKIS